MKELGQHHLIDFFDCDPEIISNSDRVREIMLVAARLSGATIVTDVFHQFNPYGVSGVVVIAESHLAIHTWPEYGQAALDVFTCGTGMSCEVAIETVRAGFAAASMERECLERGSRARQPANLLSDRFGTD